MTTPAIPSRDTEAVLLLCGRFGDARVGPKVLAPSEYHQLEQWMMTREIRPGRLLERDADDVLRHYGAKPNHVRHLSLLLSRCDELNRAIETWSSKGIWVLSATDAAYGSRLRQRVGTSGMPLLFGTGDAEALERGGICIVGSRDSSDAGLAFAETIGARCGNEQLTVISSDMRGVDRLTTAAALAAGGRVISVLSDSLEKTMVAKRHRDALEDGRLTLASPFTPDTRFTVANAMRANKYQYALSDAAVIVETRPQGGIWSGAEENRKEGWVPAFVMSGEEMAPGNLALLHLGLHAITQHDVESCDSLAELLLERAQMSPAGASPDPSAVSGNGLVAKSDPFDLYNQFLCAMRSLTNSGPVTEKEVMSVFGLERGQARKWLERAIDEGKVEKSGQPTLYSHRP